MKAATRSAVSILLSADPSIPAERIPLALSVLTGADLPASPQRVQRDLLDTKSACEYLGGASRSTLWRMERDGDLKAVWVRGKKLFRIEDLRNVPQKK